MLWKIHGVYMEMQPLLVRVPALVREARHLVIVTHAQPLVTFAMVAMVRRLVLLNVQTHRLNGWMLMVTIVQFTDNTITVALMATLLVPMDLQQTKHAVRVVVVTLPALLQVLIQSQSLQVHLRLVPTHHQIGLLTIILLVTT